MEKIKREIRTQKKEHDREIYHKNTKVNNLLTDLENIKTDLEYTQKEKAQLLMKQEALQRDMTSLKIIYTRQISQLEAEKAELEKKVSTELVKEVRLKQLEIENRALMNQQK